jgi:hypothetical protein
VEKTKAKEKYVGNEMSNIKCANTTHLCSQEYYLKTVTEYTVGIHNVVFPKDIPYRREK